MKFYFSFVFLLVFFYSYTQQEVVWENLKNIIKIGSLYTKGTAVKGQMTSKNILYGSFDENYNNGYLIFNSGSILGESKIVGFTVTESQELGFETIEYGFSFQSNKVKAYGRDGFFEQSITSQGSFKIERVNNKMLYYFNQTKIYEELIDKTEFLQIRAILKNNLAKIDNMSCSLDNFRPELSANISTNKTISISNSYGSSILWEDGDNKFNSKKFINTTFPFRLFSNGGDYLNRSISIGNQVLWTNLNSVTDGNNGLEKTNGGNWGSANSNTTFNSSSHFWIEQSLIFQNETKAIGISKNTTNILNPTNIDAGFIISKDFQIQLVFQGAVIRTFEAYSSDIIHLDYENGLIKWKLNGLILEERNLNIVESIKIVTLLKNGTSLKNIYFGVKDEIVSTSWQSTSGTIKLDISSIQGIEGPFHYFISSGEIPNFNSQYQFLRDSILGDSILIDSLTFFETMGVNQTSFQKSGLDMGEYNFSIFDHLGQLIYGGKTQILPDIILDQTSGVVLEGKNTFRSIADNAKTSSNIRFDETLNSGYIDYIISNKDVKQTIGLISDTNSDIIKYGFQIQNRRVSIIKEGEIIEREIIIIGKNAQLSIVKESDQLTFIVNGKMEEIVALGESYILKAGFSSDGIGVDIVNPSLRARQYRYIFYQDVALATCDIESATLKFKYVIPNGTNTIVTFDYTIEDIIHNSIIQTGNLLPNTEFQLNNAPFGIYLVRGTINTTPSIEISELIIVGFKGSFNPMNLYDSSPNDYSLKKNTNYNTVNQNYASAISINQILSTETNGWITFKPVLQNGGESIISLAGSNSVFLPTTNYIKFSRISHSSDVVYMMVNNLGNTVHSGIMQMDGTMALKISATQIEFVMDLQGISLQHLVIPRPSGNLRIKCWSKKLNDGFSNIICSFSCWIDPPPLTLAQVGYAEMKREIDAGYTYAVEGKVKFSFDEEYSIDSNKKLNYKILDKDNNDIAGCINGTCYGYVLNLDYNKNDNRYILDISTIVPALQINDFFTIEVTTIKKDKKYLRVQYRN